jgi:hypothetical protein
MIKKILLIFALLLKSQSLNAQTSNELYLTCRVQVTSSQAYNRGEEFDTFYRITFSPPMIYSEESPPVKIQISDIEFRWYSDYFTGYINRLTGYITLGTQGAVTGRCQQAPSQRKF